MKKTNISLVAVTAHIDIPRSFDILSCLKPRNTNLNLTAHPQSGLAAPFIVTRTSGLSRWRCRLRVCRALPDETKESRHTPPFLVYEVEHDVHRTERQHVELEHH